MSCETRILGEKQGYVPFPQHRQPGAAFPEPSVAPHVRMAPSPASAGKFSI